MSGWVGWCADGCSGAHHFPSAAAAAVLRIYKSASARTLRHFMRYVSVRKAFFFQGCRILSSLHFEVQNVWGERQMEEKA
jgi:hypothetical protein